MSERKSILLRLDPAVHDALARWAGDELRSTNAQIEVLLRRALADAGRLPGKVGAMRRPGRRHATARQASHPSSSQCMPPRQVCAPRAGGQATGVAAAVWRHLAKWLGGTGV